MTVDSSVVALVLGLAGIGGTLGGTLVGAWSTHRVERKRQVFQREQDARTERALAMKSARILDSALREAEALLTTFIVKRGQLWPDVLAVPDTAVWADHRGDIVHILEPPALNSVEVGVLALVHMGNFERAQRVPGYDDTTDLSPGTLKAFEPVLVDIRAARKALEPVAYPDHIRLPEGHPQLALLAEQRASGAAPTDAASSPVSPPAVAGSGSSGKPRDSSEPPAEA